MLTLLHSTKERNMEVILKNNIDNSPVDIFTGLPNPANTRRQAANR